MGILSMIVSALYHAFSMICLIGYWIAFCRISLAMDLYVSSYVGICSSPNAVHHPSTIPSWIADLVALSASSILNLRCSISILVFAPTFMIAIHPVSLDSLS